MPKFGRTLWKTGLEDLNPANLPAFEMLFTHPNQDDPSVAMIQLKTNRSPDGARSLRIFWTSFISDPPRPT